MFTIFSVLTELSYRSLLMPLISKDTIDSFYATKRIAVIGASRNPKKYGRLLLDALQARGFEVIAVNPHADHLGNIPCHRSIRDVPGAVTTAFAVVPPAEQSQVALECAQAGIKRLWLHEHVMKGVSNPKAIYHCEAAGIEVITGYCPFMFMPRTGFPHNLHGAITKWMGGYPR
jgi:predicted CoA-binding protein